MALPVCALHQWRTTSPAPRWDLCECLTHVLKYVCRGRSKARRDGRSFPPSHSISQPRQAFSLPGMLFGVYRALKYIDLYLPVVVCAQTPLFAETAGNDPAIHQFTNKPRPTSRAMKALPPFSRRMYTMYRNNRPSS